MHEVPRRCAATRSIFIHHSRSSQSGRCAFKPSWMRCLAAAHAVRSTGRPPAIPSSFWFSSCVSKSSCMRCLVAALPRGPFWTDHPFPVMSILPFDHRRLCLNDGRVDRFTQLDYNFRHSHLSDRSQGTQRKCMLVTLHLPCVWILITTTAFRT